MRIVVGINVLWVPLAFLSDGLTTLVLPVAVADSGGSATSLGLITFVGIGLALIVQPIAGTLSDRLREAIDRRSFMLVAGVPAMGALALVAGTPAPVGVAIGYIVVQASASAIQASQQTLIAEHIAPRSRGRAASLKTAFDIGGAFLAFIILGWLLEMAHLGAAATAIGVVLVFGMALVVLLVPRQPSRASASHVAYRGPFPAGFIRLVGARFAFLLGTYAVGRFLLFLVADRLDSEPAAAAGEAGALLGLFTLVTAAAALAIGPSIDRLGRVPVMKGGAFIGFVGALMLLPAIGLAGVLVGGLLLSIGNAGFVSANWAALVDISPPQDAGRLLGIANVGTGGAAALAGLLGPAVDLYGFVPSLLIAAAAMMAAYVTAAPSLRRPSQEQQT